MTLDAHAYRQIDDHLKAARRAAVVTHIHPDGDGVGSALALCRFIASRDLEARFITSAGLPLSLQFLDPHGETIPYSKEACPAFLRDADLIFTVDNSSVSRLGPLEADVRAASATTICIDHHLVRNEFWDLNLIDESACATGEMIWDIIHALDGEIDLPIAEAIYVAIVTDSGWFRFPKTTGRVHRMVADLLDLGVRPEKVYHEIHERNSRGLMRLMGEALGQLQFAADGQLCWVELSASLLATCQAQGEDTSEVINQMLSIEGVEIGLLFREAKDGSTKISLRSRPAHDVNVLAVANGGGGHRNAAGAVVSESLASCSRRLVAAAVDTLKRG